MSGVVESLVPNSRFGTTFLDTKYRDRAIDDEVMIDKLTGEILYRRKDGIYLWNERERIHVYEHFTQIKKRIEAYNNWISPLEERTKFNESYFSTTIMTVLDFTCNASDEDIKNNNPIGLIYGHTLENPKKIPFSITQESNGFFINIGTTPRDRALVGALNERYNREYYNYTGSDPDHVAKAAKYKEYNYLESHFVVNYTVYWYDINGDLLSTETADGYAIANENTLIPFKQVSTYGRSKVNATKLVINSISAPKLAEGYELTLNSGIVEQTFINSTRDTDSIIIDSMLISFFSTITDDLFQVADTDGMTSYLMVLGMNEYEQTLNRAGSPLSNGNVIGTKSPIKGDWEKSNIWHETIRKVHTIDDVEFIGTTETTPQSLEEMLMGVRHTGSFITSEKDETEGFYLKDEY